MLATYAKAVTRPRAAARAREGALWGAPPTGCSYTAVLWLRVGARTSLAESEPAVGPRFEAIWSQVWQIATEVKAVQSLVWQNKS
jgi:hypothetical protein